MALTVIVVLCFTGFIKKTWAQSLPFKPLLTFQSTGSKYTMLYSHHWTSVYMRETLYLAVCPVFSFKNVVPDLLGTHRGSTCICLPGSGVKGVLPMAVSALFWVLISVSLIVPPVVRIYHFLIGTKNACFSQDFPEFYKPSFVTLVWCSYVTSKIPFFLIFLCL